MVQILANPKLWDKKPVAVVGYMDLAFESDHFCLHKEDAEHLLLTNCVSISAPSSPEVEALNRRYVAVWGTVMVGRSGHMGLFNLSIQNVTRIEPMLSKEEFRAGAAQ